MFQSEPIIFYEISKDGQALLKSPTMIVNELDRGVHNLESKGLEPFATVKIPIKSRKGLIVEDGGVVILGRSRVMQGVEDIGSRSCII